jgi:hypothetical protein
MNNFRTITQKNRNLQEMGITPFDPNEKVDVDRIDEKQLEELEMINEERKVRLKEKYSLIDQINQANLKVN